MAARRLLAISDGSGRLQIPVSVVHCDYMQPGPLSRSGLVIADVRLGACADALRAPCRKPSARGGLELEREMLKRAATFFAKESETREAAGFRLTSRLGGERVVGVEARGLRKRLAGFSIFGCCCGGSSCTSAER